MFACLHITEAIFGQIPFIYVKPVKTFLLVGIFIPAIRAKETSKKSD